ncbi:MAG: hypothetical protein AB7P03_08480 [Kofleriaceae bacterium]
MKQLASLFCQVVVLAGIAAPSVAHAEGKKLRVLGAGFEPGQIDALRAEASVRGLTLEVLPTTGADEAATVIADGDDVAAVLWVADDGATLRAQAPGGRRTQAPLRDAPSGRAVAAIASSLVDDVVVASASPVDVDVNVKIRGASGTKASQAAPPDEAADKRIVQTQNVIDLGGLAGPYDAVAVHAGVGHYFSPQIRLSALGHFTWLPELRGYAATLELAHTWFHQVSPEVGIRAASAMITNTDGDTIRMTGRNVYGFGAGAFVGLGLYTSIGRLYVRGGYDLLRFSTDETVLAPNGSIGIELPLR